jgi:anti-anti-sigma factor
MLNYTVEVSRTLATFTMLKDLTVYFNQDVTTKIKELEDQGCKYFIFDLSATEWIDSMGIGCIYKAGKVCLASGKKAVVVGANEKVKYSITLLKLDKWIEFKDSIAAARAFFGL